MKYQLFYVTATTLLVSVLVLTLVPMSPVVLADDDDCWSRCATQRYECEDDAGNAYERCRRYGEEAACHQVYQRQMEVCYREYNDCTAGC